jgi:hypothetical protein
MAQSSKEFGMPWSNHDGKSMVTYKQGQQIVAATDRCLDGLIWNGFQQRTTTEAAD